MNGASRCFISSPRELYRTGRRHRVDVRIFRTDTKRLHLGERRIGESLSGKQGNHTEEVPVVPKRSRLSNAKRKPLREPENLAWLADYYVLASIVAMCLWASWLLNLYVPAYAVLVVIGVVGITTVITNVAIGIASLLAHKSLSFPGWPHLVTRAYSCAVLVFHLVDSRTRDLWSGKYSVLTFSRPIPV